MALNRIEKKHIAQLAKYYATGASEHDHDADYSALGHNHAGTYQPLDSVLTNTTASFTTTLETKLNAVEAGADVTDTGNVTSAGAVMDSEVDADIKTLSLPANTTISAFGKTLVDDADAATARATLDVDQAGTNNLAPIPDWQQFEETGDSFDIAATSSQGIAFDGTYIYVTNNTHLYKYNTSGTLQTSRDISGDGTLAKMGGMTVVSGTLYVGASNYPTASPKSGYIMTFDASDLSYIDEYSVGAQWPSSVAHDGTSFWITNYAGEAQEWPSGFASVTATHTLDAESTEIDGMEWIGDSLFINYHEGGGYPAIRQYYYDGTDFTAIRNISRPDGYTTQDMAWDSTDGIMYFNRRGYSIVSDAVVTTKPASLQQKLPDKQGWIPFPGEISRSSWTAATQTAVVNCTDADEFLTVGNRIKFSQVTNGVDKFGIVTAVSSTTFTLFMNSDYDVDDEGMKNPFYSYVKVPFGFDIDPAKYTLTFTESTDRSTAATGGTWYQLDAAHLLVIPVGSWHVKAKATVYAQHSVNDNDIKVHAALSTSTSSVSNDELYVVDYFYDTDNLTKKRVLPAHLTATLTLSSSATYNLIAKQDTTGTLSIRANTDPDTIIRATCAYL